MARISRHGGSSKPLLDDLGSLYIEPTGLFHHLVAAAGLNPQTDFRNRDLREMRFRGADLGGFDFSKSDLRGTGIRFAKRPATTTQFTGCRLDAEDRAWLTGNTRQVPSLTTSPDVLPPDSILGGKYKIGRLLGRGQFGATYLAWDMSLRTRVAIKEFLPRQLATHVAGATQVSVNTRSKDDFDLGLQQFLSDARTLSQFHDNPGIISVLDFFPENGTGYMVMEYLDGETLEQYITRADRVDIAVALQLLIPVADALRTCHVVGLIHRDISPDNIFLTTDGRVKVLDFGGARFAIGSRTTNLSVILKEGYAPFEQYQRPARQGPWTDIYALTATLYRLLTGDRPVAAPDRIAGKVLPPPSEKGVQTSPELQAVLDKGMAIQPEHRYHTVEAFLSDLQVMIAPSSKTRQINTTAVARQNVLDGDPGMFSHSSTAPGSVLGGRYKVERLLGQGGFGATYLAWDMSLRTRVAIKEFLPKQLATHVAGATQVSVYTRSKDAFDLGLGQFLSEARTLAQFEDIPGIISVLDFFPENGTGYLVMEYLDGETLEQYITRAGRLDVSVALQVLVSVCDSLRPCHAVGLIHRDISPDNIFLTSDGGVKLLDFGAARFDVGSRSTDLSVIVKEGYAPFEQYQRTGQQGPWTDIYALTATLYRLLTGDRPVAAPDRIAGEVSPPPSEKGVQTLPELQALLDKGMAIQPEQRYQTIDAFLCDLQGVLETLGSTVQSAG